MSTPCPLPQLRSTHHLLLTTYLLLTITTHHPGSGGGEGGPAAADDAHHGVTTVRLRRLVVRDAHRTVLPLPPPLTWTPTLTLT